MYKYIGGGRFLTGVPPEDIPDDEFAEIAEQQGGLDALTTCQHPEDEREAGHACLLYEHAPDKPEKTAAKAESEVNNAIV